VQSGAPCEDLQYCLAITDGASNVVLRVRSDDGGPNAIEIPRARPP